MNKKLNKSILFASLIMGTVLFGNTVWIHSKALLAQLLIQQAWSDIQNGQAKSKPWPWADTWPVARLTAPRLKQDLYVLDGANGSSFAFGPGQYRGLESTVIAGHRDTHFRFLNEIKIGDYLLLENNKGEKSHYQVNDLKVANRFEHSLRPLFGENNLTLVTCYPFEALTPNGPLRYVVSAKLIEYTIKNGAHTNALN